MTFELSDGVLIAVGVITTIIIKTIVIKTHVIPANAGIHLDPAVDPAVSPGNKSNVKLAPSLRWDDERKV